MTITLTREEAQQVLDALEGVKDMAWDSDTVSGRRLIETLRARLTEPYRQQADAVFAETNGRMRIDPVTGNVGIGWASEPEPEPVAWMMLENKLVPIHTAPPQREWQGLTDEEIGMLTVFDGLHHVEVPLLAEFIRAIEAKLKEKNGGA